jgi:hypothetical protein
VKRRHAAQILSLAALAACGGADEPVVVQPAGCVDGLEPVGTAPEPGDLRVGEAWFVGLERAQRLPWREHVIPPDRTGSVKAGIVVLAGGTLTLNVPPEARGLIALSYGDADQPASTVTLSACHGHYPSAAFPGGIHVRRPICRVPLDWRYGDERGRLRLSFGRACR